MDPVAETLAAAVPRRGSVEPSLANDDRRSRDSCLLRVEPRRMIAATRSARARGAPSARALAGERWIRRALPGRELRAPSPPHEQGMRSSRRRAQVPKSPRGSPSSGSHRSMPPCTRSDIGCPSAWNDASVHCASARGARDPVEGAARERERHLALRRAAAHKPRRCVARRARSRANSRRGASRLDQRSSMPSARLARVA